MFHLSDQMCGNEEEDVDGKGPAGGGGSDEERQQLSSSTSSVKERSLSEHDIFCVSVGSAGAAKT